MPLFCLKTFDDFQCILIQPLGLASNAFHNVIPTFFFFYYYFPPYNPDLLAYLLFSKHLLHFLILSHGSYLC